MHIDMWWNILYSFSAVAMPQDKIINISKRKKCVLYFWKMVVSSSWKKLCKSQMLATNDHGSKYSERIINFIQATRRDSHTIYVVAVL